MNREIGILFMMVAIGGVVSCIFDFFRAIRMIFKPNTAVVAISDIIFCTVGMYVITACLFKYNNGILRFYHVAGLAIGSVIYFHL